MTISARIKRRVRKCVIAGLSRKIQKKGAYIGDERFPRNDPMQITKDPAVIERESRNSYLMGNMAGKGEYPSVFHHGKSKAVSFLGKYWKMRAVAERHASRKMRKTQSR